MGRRTKRMSVLIAAAVLAAAAATVVTVGTAGPAAAGTAASLTEIHSDDSKDSHAAWLNDFTEDGGSTSFGGNTLFGSACAAASIAHAGSYKVMVQDDCGSDPNTISYRIGSSGAPTTFADPQVYVTSPSDYAQGWAGRPRVAVNSYGVVVETHGIFFGQGGGTPSLAYTVGVVVGGKILWNTTHIIDRIGQPTAIAMNDAFMVEIAYDGVASTSHLFGKVSGGDISRISGGDTTTVGKSAGLAMSGSLIIEVYGGSNVNQYGIGEDTGELFSRIGRVTTTGVVWQPARKYDNGYSASVAFDTNGRAVEVHQAGKYASALWTRTGLVFTLFGTPYVSWTGSQNYAYSGAYPQIAG